MKPGRLPRFDAEPERHQPQVLRLRHASFARCRHLRGLRPTRWRAGTGDAFEHLGRSESRPNPEFAGATESQPAAACLSACRLGPTLGREPIARRKPRAPLEPAAGRKPRRKPPARLGGARRVGPTFGLPAGVSAWPQLRLPHVVSRSRWASLFAFASDEAPGVARVGGNRTCPCYRCGRDRCHFVEFGAVRRPGLDEGCAGLPHRHAAP